MTAGFAQVREEMAQLRQEMTAGFAQLRQEMAQFRQELRQEMTAGFAQVRQEMTQLRQQTQEQFRWILGFQIVTWISILGTLLAILLHR